MAKKTTKKKIKKCTHTGKCVVCGKKTVKGQPVPCDCYKAKKNVRNTTKNPGGRPALFKTVPELEAKIDDYFKNGVKKKKVIVGKGIKERIEYIEFPTICGVAYHLGFESRQSFYDYEKVERFSYTIKRVRLFIENEYEALLQSSNVVGAIFALKNFGWKDKIETEHGLTDGFSDLIKEVSSGGIGLPIKTKP